jgi:lipoyl(octanoyl) transferase
MTVVDAIVVRELGCTRYVQTFDEMRAFTARRDESTADELWLTEHAPVYTLGQAAAPVAPGNGIAVVQTDRGGEVTYHGPGQVVLYALVDLARRGIKVKPFVMMLEQCVIDLLGRGERRPGAPGVYVDGAKIAALGIRVRRGCSYHGLALNVDMDLSPFLAIDPCGFPGLEVIDMKAIGLRETVPSTGRRLAKILGERLADA